MGNRNASDGKLRKSQINAVNNYTKNHYDRFSVFAPQGSKEEFKEVAKKLGYDSLNQFILDAVYEKIARE